ncbi:alpha/beta fold hydrolase [Sphaerimonospora mesophila]|uniref:alpha/beta fold hydrolase n=1 Tax=Sphaerimonospora mesophila TaxID=37483 RepID=UPI0007C8096D
MTVAYERSGTGEPVVLLHGIGSHRQVWDPVTRLLVTDREVIADLPGFGQSPDLRTTWPRDLHTVVAGFGAVFTELGLERPHVVGHSLGGLIALRLAQTGLVRSVTALAPAGFWDERERRYVFAVLAAARQIARLPEPILTRLSQTSLARAAVVGTLYGRPELFVPEAVAASLRTLRQSAGFDATLRAGRASDLFTGDIPDVPVTIAWGTRDRLLSVRQAARVTALIPAAHMLWLPGCGHVPMRDWPDLVAHVILQATNAETVTRSAAMSHGRGSGAPLPNPVQPSANRTRAAPRRAKRVLDLVSKVPPIVFRPIRQLRRSDGGAL